ncbi:PREDICTED: transmembrane protein 45A-like [Nelumbo nucifera]|uniref:Transmembrane protein 45A-like n=2 Tax=Nelumbo nucifera TaxID=4432 RepID=A0A822ZC95_NELNU|nr:PREDICTED: transmembrane protein 45A-like [Nelumbo nucifera]DAD42140.1 TPA_asm: hypothetical protein HUJ06_000370 [Nelumbo nucifera]
MGSLVGHVIPGLGFLVIGLWHLFNLIKLHALNPKSFTSSPWFPTSRMRYLELFLIMGGSCTSIAMELFIGPESHQPLDSDGTIPTTHLHNFEHASISLSFFIYAAFAFLFDQIQPKAHHGITQLLGALAFAQELLLFHLHSTDHMGVEGQYHLLLQIIILVSMLTTLMGISLQKSFLVSFVRSLGISFQGIWLMVMGFALWTPSLIAKGCFMNSEDGHFVVRCETDHALYRAKALVNLQFSWFTAAVVVFGVSVYLALTVTYTKKVWYWSLGKMEEEYDDDDDDESRQKSRPDESKSLIHMGKGSTPGMDIER